MLVAREAYLESTYTVTFRRGILGNATAVPDVVRGNYRPTFGAENRVYSGRGPPVLHTVASRPKTPRRRTRWMLRTAKRSSLEQSYDEIQSPLESRNAGASDLTHLGSSRGELFSLSFHHIELYIVFYAV